MRYANSGDNPPWKPVRAFDDGSKVFIEFPARIDQGEAPPLFVVGPTGESELVNYRGSRQLLHRRPLVRRRGTAPRPGPAAGRADQPHRSAIQIGIGRWSCAMSDLDHDTLPPGGPQKIESESLALRARPRRVAQFNRRVVIGVAAGACVLVFAATMIAR
jgi:Conjugal transfer protein